MRWLYGHFLPDYLRMKQYPIITLCLVCFLCSYGQDKSQISVSNRTYFSKNEILPFWFTSNQAGKIVPDGTVLSVFDFAINSNANDSTKEIDFLWGFNFVSGISNSNYFQINQGFAGLLWKGWELKTGLIPVQTNYSGLSTANGNIIHSNNARPYPEISVSTRGFKRFPIFPDYISYSARYSEGILIDERYVDNARLHHKSFYLMFHISPVWDVEAGLEHKVLWGGLSPTFGELPGGIKDYWRYVLGTSGNEIFPETDQRNVAGNQLGSYQFKVTRKLPQLDLIFFVSHPFEEKSGLKWRNWPDNLLGLHLKFKNLNQIVTGLVYEFNNTRHQSIQGKADDPDPGNYFRHGIYRSSFTYHQRMMGSPLFFPMIFDTENAIGLQSNRFYAHHLGMQGTIPGNFRWKTMTTYIKHLGLFTTPFENPHQQISGLLELNYFEVKYNFEFGLSAATDIGNSIDQISGFQVMVKRYF